VYTAVESTNELPSKKYGNGVGIVFYNVHSQELVTLNSKFSSK